MSSQYPQDELGRYVGKTPHEYPDHLNYLKASPLVRYHAGYGTLRARRRKERDRPPAHLRKLMMAVEQMNLRAWYIVETFCPDWGGVSGRWKEFGAPIWIDAIVATKDRNNKWKYTAVIFKRRRKTQTAALQEELDKRDVFLLILPKTLSVLEIRAVLSKTLRRIRNE